MCEEEVRLGRRLAPELYLGVRPLVRSDGRAGPSAHRASQATSTSSRCGASTRLHACRAGSRRGEADAHARSARWRGGSPSSTATAEPAPPGSFDAGAVAATRQRELRRRCCRTRTRSGAGSSRPRTGSRSRSCTPATSSSRTAATRGFVRDCHGDLRAEHVIVEDDTVQIFDPRRVRSGAAADRRVRRPGVPRHGPGRRQAPTISPRNWSRVRGGRRRPRRAPTALLLRRVPGMGAGEGRLPARRRAAARATAPPPLAEARHFAEIAHGGSHGARGCRR